MYKIDHHTSQHKRNQFNQRDIGGARKGDDILQGDICKAGEKGQHVSSGHTEEIHFYLM
jgi:hypothetical protein